MTNGNDSAYAMPSVGGEPHEAEPGLTKREYFAAMALQGSMAVPMLPRRDAVTDYVIATADQKRALWAVTCADALIAALNKEELK